ncbi:MAG: hypothetical protein NTX50_28700 [Candidatus Sumerlaeota bacterium]|nr:hypothetical protein [Candidatus Sumerlaeota bacterium]
MPEDWLEFRPFEIWDYHEGAKGFAKHSGPLPFAFEAIAPNKAISLPVHVVKDQAISEGNYTPPREVAEILQSPQTLIAALRPYSEKILKIERDYFERAGQTTLEKWFAKMSEALGAESNAGKAMLPIGFGTGWNAKTLGPILSGDDLDKAHVSFHRGEPPPISRELCLGKNAVPESVPGWVMITITPE